MAKQFSVSTIFALKDQVTGPVGRMKTAVSAAFTSMGKSGRVLNDVFSGAFAAGIALKGVTALTNGIKNLANTLPEYAARADSIAKTSRSLGLASDSFQKFVYAADKAGVASDQFKLAFQTLNKGLGNGTLVTALEKIDMGLASQVKAAPNAEAAFKAIASAMKDEGNSATRTAALMAAFGKQGAALTNMLGDLDNQLAAAEKYGNIITPAQLARAEQFNDTVSRLKSMWQGFGDVIRSSVIQYVTPLLTQLQEWAARNRELIATKIQDFVTKVADFIQNKLVPGIKEAWQTFQDWLPTIKNIIGFLEKFGPAIITVVAAWKLFNTTVTIAKAVMLAFNITASANPIGLIVVAVVSLIAGIALLSAKVGGLGNAFKVIGETIATFFSAIWETITNFAISIGKTVMRAIMTPVNAALDGIVKLLSTVSKIPKIGGFATEAIGSIRSFQGRADTVFAKDDTPIISKKFSELAKPYNDARDAELARQEAKREITGAATDPELLDALNRIANNTGETADNTATSKARSGAPGFAYGQMGEVDVFGTVRAGL
ncbi:hypothetical protein AGMMS49942_29020 [Spirochaetia bacterium]|nr:hypothetical protein AGMMS49942_29020 [Spirochaetia bacterium]